MALVLQQTATPRFHRQKQIGGHHSAGAGVTKFQNDDVTKKDGQIKRPVHPEYSEFNFRLFSFSSDWNYEAVQSSRMLAANGFFYTGQGDLVRCFHCSTGFKDFHITDDPLVEHARYAPDCPVLQQRLDNPSNQLKATPNDKLQKQKQDEAYLDDQKASGKTEKVVTGIKHPNYQSYAVRLSSFTGWPSHKHITPHQLAEAGFYFTGRGDIVRCFTCDGGLKQWDPLDDPWMEHCRHFPECSFVRQVKGEEYVALLQHHYQTPASPKPANQHTPCVQKPLQTLQHRAPAKIHLLPSEKTVQNQLLQMGFTEVVVDRAILGLLRGTEEMSVESVLVEIERLKEVDKTKDYLSGENIKMSDKEEECGRLRYEYNCKLCRSVQSNVLYLPCQHHCCCYSCSQRTTTCPLCGVYVQQKIKTFS